MTHTIKETQAYNATQSEPSQDTIHLAKTVVEWHQHAIKELLHMSDIPEGTEIVREEDGARVVLTGDALIAFQAGVMIGTEVFGEIPFKLEYAFAPQEDSVKAS